jgi:starch phosphorylase
MKFQMNGCLILGTWDGANIEIAEETGVEEVFIFGVRADEIHQLRKDRKNFKTDPRCGGSGSGAARFVRESRRWLFERGLGRALCRMRRWDELMRDIEGGMFGDKDYFKPLVDSVNNMKVRWACYGTGMRAGGRPTAAVAGSARRGQPWLRVALLAGGVLARRSP